MSRTVYIDLDLVLFDIQSSLSAIGLSKPDWMILRKQYPRFWYDLPLMPNAHETWSIVSDYDPVGLTGVVTYKECINGKQDAFEKHFHSRKLLIVDSKKKQDYGLPGDILIDDDAHNIARWRDMGGIGILFTDNDALRLDFARALQEPIPDFKPPSLYTAHVWDKKTSAFLRDTYPCPANYYHVADHMTEAFKTNMRLTRNYGICEVYGYYHDNDVGLITLACRYDNADINQDGVPYHITFAKDSIKNPSSRRSKDIMKEANFHPVEPYSFMVQARYLRTENQEKRKPKNSKKARPHNITSVVENLSEPVWAYGSLHKMKRTKTTTSPSHRVVTTGVDTEDGYKLHSFDGVPSVQKFPIITHETSCR